MAGQPWGDRVRLRVQPAHVTEGPGRRATSTPSFSTRSCSIFPSAGISDRGHRQPSWVLLAPGRGVSYRRCAQTTAWQGAFSHRCRAGPHRDHRCRRESASAFQRAILGEPRIAFWRQSFFTTWGRRASVGGLGLGHPGQTRIGGQRTDPVPLRGRRLQDRHPRVPFAGRRTHLDVDPMAPGLSGLHAELTSQRPPPSVSPRSPRTGVITDVGVEQALAGWPTAGRGTGTDHPLTPAHRRNNCTAFGETIGYHARRPPGVRSPATLGRGSSSPPPKSRPAPLPEPTSTCPPTTGGPPTAALTLTDPQTQHQDQCSAAAVGARGLPRVHWWPTQIVVLDEFPWDLLGQDRPQGPCPHLCLPPPPSERRRPRPKKSSPRCSPRCWAWTGAGTRRRFLRPRWRFAESPPGLSHAAAVGAGQGSGRSGICSTRPPSGDLAEYLHRHRWRPCPPAAGGPMPRARSGSRCRMPSSGCGS